MKFFNFYYKDGINLGLNKSSGRCQKPKYPIQENPTKYWMSDNSQTFFQIPKNSAEAVLYPLADYYKNHLFTKNSEMPHNPKKQKTQYSVGFPLKTHKFTIHSLIENTSYQKMTKLVNL